MRALLGLLVFLSATHARADGQIEFEACKMNVSGAAGQESSGTRYACQKTVLSSEETAFVLVDFWKSDDPFEASMRVRAASLLKSVRNQGFYVIHGAGDVILTSPAYLKFRAEVEAYLGADYCKTNLDFGSRERREIYGYRTGSPPCAKLPQPNAVREFSTIVVPEPGRAREFLVRYEDEFRFLLWKFKIKNLVYLGGALDLCMLNRAYGIDTLVNTERRPSSFNLYILGDLVGRMDNPTAEASEQAKTEILLKSFSYSKGEIVLSPSIVFKGPATAAALPEVGRR